MQGAHSRCSSLLANTNMVDDEGSDPKLDTLSYVLSNLFFSVLFFQITALKIKHNPFAKAFLDAKER